MTPRRRAPQAAVLDLRPRGGRARPPGTRREPLRPCDRFSPGLHTAPGSADTGDRFIQQHIGTPPLAAADRRHSGIRLPEEDALCPPWLDFSLSRLYYHSGAARPPLRIGVMINGPRTELFARMILRDVRACDFADIVCVIERCAPEPKRAPRPPLPVRAARTLLEGSRRRALLYQSYLRHLDRRYAMQPDPRTLVDCSDLLAGAERIEVAPLQTRYEDRFPPDAIDRIKALDLDVVLRFGFRIVRGEALNVARHGVWSFHHGDSERYRGGPPLLWELMERSPLSGAVLQRLEDALDAGPILCRAVLGTCARPSVSVNRFNVYWSTQHFVIQKLHELHRHGAEHVARRTWKPAKYLGRRAIYRTPHNIDMARWLAPAMARTAVRKLRARNEIMHWSIGLRRSAEPLHRRPQLAAMRQFSWLRSPRGHFWADPFLIADRGDAWLFFEDFRYAEKRGVIACGRVEDGGLRDVRTALERPYHLSFPHVFRRAGEVWMVPESADAGEVQLYRAKRFPDEWILERKLLDIRAVDPVPFEFGGRWWMLVSPMIVTNQVALTLLFLAAEPWGPWVLHPESPVCSDVRWARAAGAVIRDGDRLIRPSQNCSAGYGHSVCFNRVKVLTETSYEEDRGAELPPDVLRPLEGVHTYNRIAGWEVIDGRMRTPRVVRLDPEHITLH